jgi:hypothetical protein
MPSAARWREARAEPFQLGAIRDTQRGVSLNRTARSLLLCTLLAAGCATLFAQRPRRLQVQGIESLGFFSSNAPSWGRDAGNSGRVGNRIIWIFGDTLTLDDLRTATAGWARSDLPFHLEEAVDDRNSPLAFFPFAADEEAFNRAHAEPPDCCSEYEACPRTNRYCECPPATDCATRIAIWPGDVFEVSGGEAIVYYDSFIIGAAPYDFERLGTGLARFQEGDFVSQRILGADGKPWKVFTAEEPGFATGVLVEEATAPMIYLFATTDPVDCNVDVLIARVPLAQAGDRSAYTFWNGSAWVADLGAARPILDDVEGGLGSVMWNDYLGSYSSGTSGLCTGGSKFFMRTAPRPEGPWSEPVKIDLAALGATRDSYAGMFHPELGSGRQLVMSFYVPKGAFEGSLRLALITLR